MRVHTPDYVKTIVLDAEGLEEDYGRYLGAVQQAGGKTVTFAGRAIQRAEDPGALSAQLYLAPPRPPQYFGFPEFAPGELKEITERSLMVTALGVVEDEERTTGNGVWTFGYLMSQIANASGTGLSPSTFTRRWLAHWETNQTVNTFASAARGKHC